jgi:hypothetical protein
MILEQDGGRIAINPDRFDKLITALRTADGKTITHAELKIGDSILTEESPDMKALLLNLLVEVQLACMFTLKI